ncbi:MAG: aldehyde ferredoxin oxidoreductase family protein [Pseudomonadota bacterium]
MKEIVGTSNRVLEVDLSKKRVEIHTVQENDRTLFLGGKGLGMKLLYDRLTPGIDPLGEENMIAFMPGVLMGTGAPCSGRFAAVTKSPLTGIMTSSSCGGPFGMQLKTAGWDGLIVKGTASAPMVLMVTEDGAEFRDGRDIWGLDALSAQGKIIQENSGVLAIGPAGENLVRYANIASGERYLGRAGMGAVMGSKNLKAIVTKGGAYKIRPRDRDGFEKARKKGINYINNNVTTSKIYRDYGTAATVNINNSAGILPVHNFRDGMHEDSYEISGEAMGKKHDTRHHTCKPCTILCGHRGNFNGNVLQVPEYETIALLGSNLGIFDSVQIAKWNRICSEMGMDTISSGGTMAWMMEASEKGLIRSGLKFGSQEGVSEALYDIAYGRGFGKEMALGVRELSERYGGKDFAIHVKGLEMAAYDPRGAFGQGLSFAVANRGACHLSAFTVGLEVFFGLLNPYRTDAKPEFTRLLESLFCCINSLHTCLFTSYAYLFDPPLTKYTPNSVMGFLMQNVTKIAVNLVDFSLYRDLWSSITGIGMSKREFLKAGDRIHVLERFMNTREGISRKDDTLPFRMLHEGRKCDLMGRPVPLEKMLDRYYRLRGYDEDGIPTEKTLRRLVIA